MKRILWAVFFLILTFTNVGSAETIQTWLGTGLNPVTTSEYPERDSISSLTTVIGTAPAFVSRSAVLNQQLYIFSGSDIYRSSDAMVWDLIKTSSPVVISNNGNIVVWKNKLWQFGSYNNNNSIYSSDGITWLTATTTMPITNLSGKTAIVVSDSLVYVIAAGGKTVIKSSDGVNFTVVTTAANFTAYGYQRSGYVNNLLFISSQYVTEAFVSSDGISWFTTSPGNIIDVSAGRNIVNYNGYLIDNTKYTRDGHVWGTLSGVDFPLGVMRGHIYFLVNNTTRQIKRSY